MEVIGFLKRQIYLPQDVAFETLRRIKYNGQLPLLDTTMEFARYMLALKAARSILAKDEVYTDCIYDFYNYFNLSREVLCKLLGREDIRWTFNTVYFNRKLNGKFGVGDITFLLNPDVDILAKARENDKGDKNDS